MKGVSGTIVFLGILALAFVGSAVVAGTWAAIAWKAAEWILK